ncbi:hypothetical protein OSB04_000849 [Centaurea solstitialis]|uniref:Uncharacterized protein n=1 Tax=Centaurea solstitialis TaxID=347529 RepID=A0AA38TPW7_9ASTR|nr:hypothetical protein OSB04_000849 [Centaurea solstitialis]
MDPVTEMVDKSVALLSNLSTISEGCLAIAREGGIPLLVEVVETGSQRGKENAASILLQLCLNSPKYCRLVLQEGAVPPLVALSQSGTSRAKEKLHHLSEKVEDLTSDDFDGGNGDVKWTNFGHVDIQLCVGIGIYWVRLIFKKIGLASMGRSVLEFHIDYTYTIFSQYLLKSLLLLEGYAYQAAGLGGLGAGGLERPSVHHRLAWWAAGIAVWPHRS